MCPAVAAVPTRRARSALKRPAMNKEQIKGAVKEAAGKVQQKAGELVDSPSTIAKGVAKQIQGKGLKAVGDLKEGADKALDR